jgi:acyl-coenzyme A thioesterase PaaI-like protein
VLRPGDRHFVLDLDLTALLVSATRCVTRAPLTDAVRASGGGASVGMLITMVDLGGSDPAMVACRPDWTATQDVSVHAAGPLTEGPIVVDAHLVRVGKKVIVVSARAYDGHGEDDLDALVRGIDEPDPPTSVRPTLAASGLITFARIPGSAAPGMDGYDPSAWIGQVRPKAFTAPAAGTMYARLGAEVVDAATGQLQLACSPYVANSIGTINGGVLAVLVEVAAEALCPGRAATDMQIHFLSQLKVGPARTRGHVLREQSGHAVATVEIVDAGNDDRLLALATVTLQ